MLTFVALAVARDIVVESEAELRAAALAARPGDTIEIQGEGFTLANTIALAADGTAEAPITLRSDLVTLRSTAVEAFKLTGAYWVIERVGLEGACADDSDCEHAIHVAGNADGTVIRYCTLVDFNAQIKANGEDEGAGYVWPDDVLVEGNVLYDTRPRQTSNPVTKLDVVGGRRWTVHANMILDFEKAQGDGVSYGAFLKGNSKDGVFEGNLVRCAMAFEGGYRVGLSLGGGGTSPDSICEEGTCTPEHEGGVLRNNIVASCSDVGIYLNKAADTEVVANTLYATEGIDVRFDASTAHLTHNVLDADIKERDDGSATLGANEENAPLDAWFAAPGALDFTLLSGAPLRDAGTPVDGLTRDFCGLPRDGAPDLGALEYTTNPPCDTTTPHPLLSDEGAGGNDTSGTGDTGRSSDTGDGGEDACGCDGGTAATTLPLGVLVLSLLRRRPSDAASRRPRR